MCPRLLSLAVFASLAWPLSSQADTFTWNQTAGGAYGWNTSANWLPATGFPNLAGDAADLSVNLGGAQTISLNQAITVGALTLDDTGSTSDVAYTIAAGTSGTLTFDNGASGATLTSKTVSATANDITAPITIGSNGLTTDVQTGSNLRFSGTFGGGNLTKTGAGTLVLNGNGSGLTGDVVVSQGIVQVSTANSLDFDNAVSVSAGAMFRSRSDAKAKSISGSGTVDFNINGSSVTVGAGTAVANTVLVNSATTYLAPGDASDSTGTLTLQRSAGTEGIGVRLTAGELRIELGGTGAGAFDQLAILSNTDVSTLTINSNFNLTLTLSYAPTAGDLFKIVDIDGAVAITGLFAQGSSVSATFGGDTYNFNILYNSSLGGGDGNDIVLQTVAAVPEPSTYILLGLGGLVLLGLKKRRRIAVS